MAHSGHGRTKATNISGPYLARISHTHHGLRRVQAVRSARRRPKSVAEATVEAFDAADARLDATLRAALCRQQGASSRLPDAPASRRTAFLPCWRHSAAQTVVSVRIPG